MRILGLNNVIHDAAAVLVEDGELVAAVEEERWFRDDKHTGIFPARSVRFCLERLGDLPPDERHVDRVAVNIAPRRALGDAGSFAASLLPGHRSRTNRRAHLHLRHYFERTARELRQTLRAAGFRRPARVDAVPHHDAHAASAFFVSPFDEAAVLTVDGRGEWATTSFHRGRDNRLEPLGSLGLPHSLGILYAAFTHYLGFHDHDEFKVMGLASYGDPARFRGVFRELVHPTDTGFRLATEHFDEHLGSVSCGEGVRALLGLEPRVPESELGREHYDLAAALQERTEEIGLHLARLVHARTGSRNLCLAGGVALNCVMNQRILEETDFERIFVQPASYDAGGALGAAYWIHHQELGRPRGFRMDRADYGPEYGDDEIEAVLRAGLLRYRRSDDIARDAAEKIAEGRIVGWFQGRAEFGPRALGHRSILADPTRPDMQDHVNDRVKHREDFRPFAPSAHEERFHEMFEGAPDPFMTKVVPVREEFREQLPAITHVDGTARLQTVSREANPLYHRLIGEFEKRRGVPVVLNTSFNVRGEPMVCQPKDALRCFFTTGIDHLAIGSFLVDK